MSMNYRKKNKVKNIKKYKIVQVGDQLVSVDGTSLVGVTQDQAAEVLKGVGDEVCLVVARNPHPDADQVSLTPC